MNSDHDRPNLLYKECGIPGVSFEARANALVCGGPEGSLSFSASAALTLEGIYSTKSAGVVRRFWDDDAKKLTSKGSVFRS